MICAWTVTSSAVVGSSAMSSARLSTTAMYDHDALPHAAGELVRIVVEALGSRGDADALEHVDRFAPRHLADHADEYGSPR